MSNENTVNTKTYTIVPVPKMGMVTPEFLKTVVRVARNHNIPLLKFTEAQRLAFIGQSSEEIEQIWQELGHSSGPQKPVGIHYIKACPGKAWCKYGVQDSLALGAKSDYRRVDQ